ncbi:telomere-associated protein RIF1 [Parambassis ranga]|uniref:Telomere-associated protein RIF1 n=1 Tax=Parambassis ranga TaxID=210632 RepID=A0A6P7H2X0_9TELE|nr:telomere-associated protein RIF1 [Parambassis ranga]
MMATAGPPSTSSFLPLLESVEDNAAAQPDQIDAYLTIANRLSGEEGRQFLPAVEKHFSRLGKAILAHLTSQNAELSQAALQTLGFCVYHSHVVSGLSETFASEIFSALCSLVTKSTDKNTCTRALWVISKQSFPADVVAKKVPLILTTLESVWNREDVQSVVMEHEALNVVIRMLEQVPPQMGTAAVQWAKLVIPLVVHSASKVRLRAAAAMEMGMPLLLEKQAEVAAVIEPIMSSKLVPELQKLFKSKNEMNVLKLWPLFVKLLGKLLHRGGPFINSLLHLEELGFRSSSPTIKKIAFIAWKSLIDNFALNPDILSSAKRMKLLMQPLISIQVRTEALLLTKVEVWWYLVVQLGPNLSPNFDQVSVPLLQSTLSSDTSSVLSTPSRAVNQNGSVAPSTPKTGTAGHPGFNSPAVTPRMNLNSSLQASSTFPSIQLLGLEMLLHYLLGPEVVATAAKNKLTLSLEPLNNTLLSGAPSFTKHAAVLISNIRDGFNNVGKDAPDPLLAIIWKNLVRFVSLTIESVGSKKDRQGCEVLTLTLQALQSIVASEALPADKVLILFEATVKGIPQRVLGSASYQVGKMDVLNGTPALFLILLLFNSSMLPAYIEDERFFHCLQTLVGCGLSGPTSPLAFAEAVLGAISCSSASLQNKEQLCRMWSVMVGPLTDTITQSNEVNQGDALEHNFSAVHSALMVPITHLLHGVPLPQAAQKSMLSSWSKLYKVFARCSALVITAEENICCEELCAKVAAAIDREVLKVPSTLNAVSSILQVMVECVDFSPYTPHFQQKLKSPHTPVNWMKKRNKVLGNLTAFQSLLVQCLELYLEVPKASSEVPSEATGSALLSIISTLFTNLVLANAIQEALSSLISPLTLFYKKAGSEPHVFSPQLMGKLEKLLSDILSCLQNRSTLAYNDELLNLLSPLLCELFPHKNKQLRTLVAQFWNSTFANTVRLTYPDQIRPVLSQVKQKTPIILPGFEAIIVSDELSGQYSSESSQLETKLSGIPVSAVGKRDSLPGKAAELKEKSANKTSKPVSTKLDFGSPKPPRRDVLEEEASIDFVFIPPETKERVLTEHQKEVKRTKRVDIPAMYNNLDASLDTTVFTQYTQSQEDSLDKQPTEQADSITKEAPAEVPEENEEDAEVLIKATQDFTSPTHTENVTETQQQEEVIPESTDVSMEDDAKSDGRPQDVQPNEDTSPNLSASSDVVSGTPQKPNSRRQSFITLEKYVDGKPGSPSSVSFTGPLVKKSNSQERSNKTSSSQASGLSTASDSQTRKTNSQSLVDSPESPRRPKDSMHSEPVRLTERLPSDSTVEEDIIPDTQVEAEDILRTNMSSTLEEMETSSQEDISPSQMSSKVVRRSGRSRVRPLLPGEDPVERDSKYTLNKRKRSGDELKTDAEKSQGRPNTRSKQAAEDGSRRLRTRTQSESSQNDSQSRARKKMQLYSNSQEFLDKPERKKRRSSQLESSQTDTPSDHESQSQRRLGRPRKSLPNTSESSQTATHDDEPKGDSQKDAVSFQAGVDSQDLEKTVKGDNEMKKDSPITSSPKTEVLPQESVKGTEKEDPQLVTPPPKDESQDLKSETNQLKQEQKAVEAVDDNLSQEESQTITPSDGQSKRRGRRSKALSEAAESENKSENTDSSGRQTRSSSQAAVSAEGRAGGRTRRSKVHEELSKSSLGSTPDSSQDLSGSESSQGRGRRSRSSPALAASVESSEAESSETLLSKKNGRKSQASLQSSLALESKRASDNMEEADASQQADTQIIEATSQSLTESEGSSKTHDLLQVTGEEQSKESQVELEADTQTKTDSDKISMPLCRDEQKDSESNGENTSAQDVEMPESVGISDEQCVDIPAPPSDMAENLPLSEPETVDVVTEKQNVDKDTERPAVPEDARAESQTCQTVSDEPPEDKEAYSASQQPTEELSEQKVTSMQDDQTQITEDEEKTHTEDALTSELISGPVSQESPVKQKDLEAVMAPDVGQSPSSSKIRGTWSPSASPSTSILKKAQKRSLEVETPSPLVKSRRVSFANPIQHQETADDIDRRSPAIRTSSPRRSKASSIHQPKHITTPTKGFMILSPRNLHSPTHRSSKKCLISEMSQEPHTRPKDCIYPALVGCSTPVEAVLPHISSNMWSRGFGQLVRARNIKTVGDLSALTPSEIKMLPIRSPKISNVKKALKIYEQQRKGRGGDELKSFDETEMMTSELEENAAPQTVDDEDKTAEEPLATELVDEPVSADGSPERDASADQLPDPSDQRPEGGADRLLSQVQSLNGSMTPLELSRCSPQQLVQVHDQLGGLMRRVVVELQARLTQTDDKL